MEKSSPSKPETSEREGAVAVAEAPLLETYERRGPKLLRRVTAGRFEGVSSLPTDALGAKDKKQPGAGLWWQLFLRGMKPDAEPGRPFGIVDLFSGSGGFSVGVHEAARAVGLAPRSIACADMDGDALGVYKRNFDPAWVLHRNVADLVDYHVYGRGAEAEWAYPPEIIEPSFARLAGKVDMLIAGPPCQGHSNLNNHTRRDDPRNQLYLAAVATGLALDAKAIVVENVPDVRRDALAVVETARKVLESSGFHVSDAVLSATELGGGQTRKRHFLVATRRPHLPLEDAARLLAKAPMTLRDMIGNLEDHRSDSPMDASPELSVENRERIDYLFDNEIYDLPDHVRPECHRNGHSYPSVYGRLSWEKPSQTITTGFMTPGRGRYIHPSRRRVLTPREAARVQGFPDSFDFVGSGAPPSRASLAKWIGDAVPSWLGYTAALCALTGL